MKIWITYNSAFGLQCGGLERVWVHFWEPQWVDQWRSEADDDEPFMQLTDRHGRRYTGWHPMIGYGMHSISFGKIFGYGDSNDENMSMLAKFVWEKLEEHFGVPFMDWDKTNVSPKDFCLEIDLKISFTVI